MPFIDTNGLKVIERLPGWKERYVHSPSMTFAHYEFALLIRRKRFMK